MTNAVYCLCSSEPQANAILTHLRNEGFNSSEISVLLQQEANTRDISLKEDAIRGVKIGSVVGALLALTVPGVGAVLAIGPLLAALLGGATAGGVVGGLVGGAGTFKPLGLPEDISLRLENGLRKGDILIAVHSDDLSVLRKAEGIFKTEGADDTYRHEERVA